MFGCVPCVATVASSASSPGAVGGTSAAAAAAAAAAKSKSPTPSLGYDYDDGDLGSQQEPGPDEFMPGRQNSTMMARMAQGTLRGGANNNRGVGNGSGSGSGGGGGRKPPRAQQRHEPFVASVPKDSSSDYANDW